MPTEVPADDITGQPDTSPVRIGCADLPPGLRRERYFERLDYLECEGTLQQLPKAAVLRRWRKEAGQDSRFGLLAPQVITHKPGPKGYGRKTELSPEELAQAGWFRPTEVVARAVDELAQAVAALEADAVVFRSPPDFAPSASNRDVLRGFFSEIASDNRLAPAARVWEPQGLWEPQVAAKLAAELGVVYACDPMSNDPLAEGPEFYGQLPGDQAYFRLMGLGLAQQRFDDYAAETLMELVEGYDRVWIVFAHIHKYPDAIRLRRALEP